ncbi:MAG: hypothetical protein FWC56_00055 [Phycisphaerae bacterium]|nr:hypothetical protein [Phycisphaerae bacterium]
MTAFNPISADLEPVAITPTTASYTGEVVYMYAFDIAYEMPRLPIRTLLGQPIAHFRMDVSKRNPRQHMFFSPQMVLLPPVEYPGPQGRLRVERAIKLLPLGSISITMRVPFTVRTINDLVAYHDITFSTGSLELEVRRLAEEARQELAPYCSRPASQVRDEEAYTVFNIRSMPEVTAGSKFNAEDWLRTHRREVAALLTQEEDVAVLSQQEVEESTSRLLSYYKHDLVVMDWDAALIVADPRDVEETLYVMELANLQLSELEAYDRILDSAVERSYRDLEKRGGRSKRAILRDLREIRIDLARLSDELSNITKFFGDWHLARIYQILAKRFHLSDWTKTINSKLTMLDNLYSLHKLDQNNRLMLILEATIVLLFIIDLVILVLGMRR